MPNHLNINNNHLILNINHLSLLYGIRIRLSKKNIPSPISKYFLKIIVEKWKKKYPFNDMEIKGILAL